MAEQIDYQPPRYNPREALMRKLEAAPSSHAEALLDAYEILQLLRDKGILEIAKGTLGSGEKVMGSLSETMESDAVITFVRNLVVLAKIAGGMNPAVLEGVQKALLENAEAQRKQSTPGFFSILRLLFGANSRRAMAAMGGVLQAIGQQLGAGKAAQDFSEEHKKTYRHSA